MHLVLTGATGLVGSAVLHHMINTPAVTTVSVLSRRPVPMAEGHSKVNVILHKDFTSFPPDTMAQLKGADGIVWALGISQASVSKEEYEKITFDYTVAAAEAFSTLSSSSPSSPFKFVFVSGEGATTNPGLTTMRFGVVKGKAEQALLELGRKNPTFKPYSVRPGGVDPTAHPEILPYIPQSTGLTKVLRNSAFATLRCLLPSQMSPTRDLARVLTDLAMGDGEPLHGKGVSSEGDGRILQNVGMRRLAGLD